MKIKKEKSIQTSNFKNITLEFLQKLGRGLMLPISVLPFAGILLGIGGAIGANSTGTASLIASGVFKGMSEIVFANLPILFCLAIVITFTNDAGAAAVMGVISYLVFNSFQTIFIHFDENHQFANILWFHNQTQLSSLVSTNLGITSLQTSLFGGILVAFMVAYIYNKFKYIQLPNLISFFNGVRFLPFILIPVSAVIAMFFLIFWPWIGLGINWSGEMIAQAPLGVDGLVYGIFTRALMPFGLHQIVVAVAYQTAFGGNLQLSAIQNLGNISIQDKEILVQTFRSFTPNSSIQGDQNIWNYINSVPLNQINNTSIFSWFKQELGVYAGRFTQDYPTYLGMSIGIGVAIILTADKDKRKATAAVLGSAMGVAFLTGITEPLEFTFLFISPILYYAIYVPLSGVSYLLMQVVGAHVGVGFARGFIDLIIYGALPVAKGTRFYWAFLFAAIQGLIIFTIFYFTIKKLNIPTPGRNGNEVVLMDKKTYQKSKSEQNNNKNSEKCLEIIEALGGIENIKSISACATRLRIVLITNDKVSNEKINLLGSSGVIFKGNNLQLIFGGLAVVYAEIINNDFLKKTNCLT